ncbi:MAG TPA: 1,4-alpha-glucan branching protein domain-containing protein [Chitinivibrionales bacterium]|nr:1,4-alpha-glucan branching protein domain-containing protein [Chitinivibrionales bacterium]
MANGYLALVLHAHLPYVRHPEYESFLEERWFLEAMTETYISTMRMLERLVADGVPCKITYSVSPTLLSMMEDPLLQERYLRHITKLCELAEREIERNAFDERFKRLAEMYRWLFTEARDYFLSCDCRLAVRLKALHERGTVELITTSATHALLPVAASQPAMAEAQVATGLSYFEEVFGFRPRGIWLPECAYAPGLDDILRREGVRYFLTESHAISWASNRPMFGLYAPLYTPSGAAAFGRDEQSTEQVWSSKKGYPGDPWYREFYRDIGYELDMSYIGPYIASDRRVDTGIKYHRITGRDAAWKEPYEPSVARQRAADHAGDFLGRRIDQVQRLSSSMNIEPVIVTSFDAELFGHWWFEGPQWLDFLIRKTVYDQNTVALTTPGEFLARHPVHQIGVPYTSSWGYEGYFEAWINGKTDWIYPHLFESGRRLHDLASRFSVQPPGDLASRALKQCCRELLLAQSSDWPFIISNGTAEQYAVRRVKDHLARFRALADAIDGGAINERQLSALECIDNIFPSIDYRVFAGGKAKAAVNGEKP